MRIHNLFTCSNTKKRNWIKLVKQVGTIWLLEFRHLWRKTSSYIPFFLLGAGAIILGSILTIPEHPVLPIVPESLVYPKALEYLWQWIGMLILFSFSRIQEELYHGKARLFILYSSRSRYYFGTFFSSLTYWLFLTLCLFLAFSFLHQRITPVILWNTFSTIFLFLSLTFFLSIGKRTSLVLGVGYLLSFLPFMFPFFLVLPDISFKAYWEYLLPAYWYEQAFHLSWIPFGFGVVILLIGYLLFRKKDLI